MSEAPKSLFKRAIDYFGDRSKSISELIFGLRTGTNAIEVNEFQVLTITPAWRAIYIIKDIMATMPLNLYERSADGDINLSDHRLNKLISKNPHALYTPFEWMSAMMVNALVCGNAIAYIHRDGNGQATALEVVPYDQVHEFLMGPNGTHYIVNLKNGKNLHSDDIVHFKGLSINGIVGLNTTLTHKETYATEIALRDYVKSFLENGAFLSGVIEVAGQIAPENYKRMKSSWDDAFGGSRKAGKTAILEGGSKFTPIQATIAQTGYEVVKDKSASDISRILGVPLYMIDGENKPTYAGAEQQGIDFKKFTIDGWCTKIEQELNRKLIPSQGQDKYFFAFDKSGLTSGDMKTMGEYYTKLFNIGVLNRNEIRAILNRNNVEDGDRYFVQGNNMIPVDKIDEAIALKTQGNVNSQEKEMVDMQTIKE